jgi:hypothetical protein
MIRKLLALLLALCLTAGGFTLVALAAEGDDDLILIFEESFEEYEADVNVSSTLMPNFFVCDANAAIGGSAITVEEATNGDLYLKSHCFTQIYPVTPIVGTYELSLDVFSAQGNVQSGVFIRAPKTTAAYYEADGHPDTSTGHAGLFLYTHGGDLGVNIKTYDENASKTTFLQNNTVTFPLPDGVSYPYTLLVQDSGTEIAISVNETPICRVTFTDPDKVYSKHPSQGKFFGSAKLFDAQGKELASYTDPLLSSDASYIGWTTRNSDMIVDNVTVKVEAAYQALLAIGKLPSKVTEKNMEDVKEIAAEARALYDALPEDKKALVINYGKLTKAEESIAAIENVTEAPTEPPTEAPTEAPTDPVTEETTEELTGCEVCTVDDSLAIWILIAVMIVAVCGAAGFITVKVRK